MANAQPKSLQFALPITKSFPPPESNDATINTIWEEEVFRNRSKAVRIQINEINGKVHIGLGNWFYSMQSKDWAPCKGQLNIPVEAWKNLEIIRNAVNVKLDNYDLDMQKVIEEASMNIFYYINLLKSLFPLRINFHS